MKAPHLFGSAGLHRAGTAVIDGNVSTGRWRRRRTRRYGFLYLVVLFASLIVATIAVSGLSLMNRAVLQSQDGMAMIEARQLADSAVALGLARINEDARWRTTYVHGVTTDAESFGGGTVAFTLFDDDGDLSDDPADGAVLEGTGRVGQSVFVRRVTLEPASPIGALGAAVAIDDDFRPKSAVLWNTDGIAAFNGNVDATSSGSVITSTIERTGTSTALNIVGEERIASEPRRMPGPDWKRYYLTQGTPIEITRLPRRGGRYRLERTVLHPDANPYGETNRLGIYVIDCRKERLEIDECRIKGTLLLLNPKSGTRIGHQVVWEPAIANFPALLVDGDLDFRLTDTLLREATLAVNFNPAGFPYRGIEDSDLTDRYPSRIRGLVYVDGELTFDGSGIARVDGLLVAKRTEVRSSLTVTFQDHYQSDPPPGFRAGPKMRLAPGSWQRRSR